MKISNFNFFIFFLKKKKNFIKYIMSLNYNISLISYSTIISKDTSIKEIGTPNKSHPVRKFLKFDNNKTLCSFCPASFSKSTGISTIKRHFERHHEEVYNQIKKVA